IHGIECGAAVLRQLRCALLCAAHIRHLPGPEGAPAAVDPDCASHIARGHDAYRVPLCAADDEIQPVDSHFVHDGFFPSLPQ
ncbi:hypothetical protein Cfor_01404, partial [Coptotermes formosanus]